MLFFDGIPIRVKYIQILFNHLFVLQSAPVRSRVGSCLTSWRRGAGWDRSWCTPARAPWSGFGPIFNTLACHLGLFLLSVFSICSDLPGRLSSEDGSPMLIRSRLLCGAEPSVLEPSTLTIAWISFKRLNIERFANAGTLSSLLTGHYVLCLWCRTFCISSQHTEDCLRHTHGHIVSLTSTLWHMIMMMNNRLNKDVARIENILFF